jgi:hypothetical protein
MSPAAAPTPIHPDTFFTTEGLHKATGLPPGALLRARREGRLRYCVQAGRVIYRGAWVLAWLEGEARQEVSGAS